jgi:hypothetical protein
VTHTPLTLEFVSEAADPFPGHEDTVPEGLVVVEPSLYDEGRIFLSAAPQAFGRKGVHMLPDEARAVRDHLSKLLLEPVEEQSPQPAPESVQSRIDRAVERLKREQSRRPKLQFRLEFKLGSFEGVLGRVLRGR